MPKIKYLKPEAPQAAVGRLIAGYASQRKASTAKLASYIGRSENTVLSRIRNPGDLTLLEATTLCKRLDIPIAELRDAIRYS